MGKNQSKQPQYITSNFLKTKAEKGQLPEIIRKHPKNKRYSCENIQKIIHNNNNLDDDINLENFKLDDKWVNTKQNKNESNDIILTNSKNFDKNLSSSNNIQFLTKNSEEKNKKEVNKLKRQKYNSIKELPIITNNLIESNVSSKYETEKYKNINNKIIQNNEDKKLLTETEKHIVPIGKYSAKEVISVSTINDLSKFNLIKVIGKGTFGKVVLVTLKDNPKNFFALKILKKEHLVSTKNVKNIINERKILSDLDNNFIVKLRFTFQSKEKLFMAFDYHNGGELFFHLQQKKRFSEDEVKIYASEIYYALSYLHSKLTLYRDIKPENIILDKNGHIKLVDFGLAKKLGYNKLYTTSFCGTNEYIRKKKKINLNLI